MINHLRIVFEGKRAVSFCTAPFEGDIVFGSGNMSICEILKPVNNIRDYQYVYFGLGNLKRFSKEEC